MVNWIKQAFKNLFGRRRKGRYPKEYQAWIVWEVALPLVAPILVFIFLATAWRADHDSEYGVRALISVAGTGDLLIFGAFLLINAGAKFRALGEMEGHREYLEDGELNGVWPFWIAIVFLLAYMGFRFFVEVTKSSDVETWKFAYGGASAVLIVMVVLWIDCAICKMHIRLLQRKAHAGLISNYYNV